MFLDKPPYVLKFWKNWNDIFPDVTTEKCINSNGYFAIQNSTNKTITIDQQFDESLFNSYITVYTPTGYYSNEDYSGLAAINRGRVDSFSTTGISGVSSLSGTYYFSGYTDGFPTGYNNMPQQFPA